MASESLSRRVNLFLAQEICFFKQDHGRALGNGSGPAALGSLLCGRGGTVNSKGV